MKIKFRRSFLFLLLIHTAFLFGQALVPNTTGYFIYTPAAPLDKKPIKVYYRIPSGNISTMPILFSFHGDDRDASNYRDYWISMANANGFMVFAPEFNAVDFIGGDGYQMGNVFVDGDNPTSATLNPINEWTFSIIDPLFEAIKGKVSGTQQTFDAWGHSGGAQFIHRFRMYMPDSKLNLAICSNAGWYTVPDILVNFPYGIKKSTLSNNSLTVPFSKKLIVHLGLSDTDPDSIGLRHNQTVDDQQGLYRLARGRYFFTTSQTIAQSVNVPFNWQKYEVAGVGHDAQRMANDALKYLIQSQLSVNEELEEQSKNSFSAQVYPNPSDGDFTLKASNANFDFKVYDLQGKLMEQRQMIPTQSTSIGANYPAGIYPIIVTQDKQIKVLKLIKK
jgi:hypothetical protein